MSRDEGCLRDESWHARVLPGRAAHEPIALHCVGAPGQVRHPEALGGRPRVVRVIHCLAELSCKVPGSVMCKDTVQGDSVMVSDGVPDAGFQIYSIFVKLVYFVPLLRFSEMRASGILPPG